MANRKVRLTKDASISYDEPFDRLTHLAQIAMQAMQDSEYYDEGDRLIVLLDNDNPPDAKDGMGGASFIGFAGPVEALVVLLGQVEAFGVAFELPLNIVTMSRQRGGDQ